MVEKLDWFVLVLVPTGRSAPALSPLCLVSCVGGGCGGWVGQRLLSLPPPPLLPLLMLNDMIYQEEHDVGTC